MKTRRIMILALLFLLVLTSACCAEAAYDADSDELLNGVIARAETIHNDQIGYPVNEDVRLDGFYEWYLKNGVKRAMLNNV